MIYFISDTHFNHDKEFIYVPRGFKSITESNETIIRHWNKVVKPNDDIYVLGDFFLGTDLESVKEILSRLKGKIHLIIGNHDTNAKLGIYRNTPNIVEVVWAKQIEYKGIKFYLSHYPTQTSNLNVAPKQAVYNLFGHTHSKSKFYQERPYMYNVAVDAHNNYPVSITQVMKDIDAKIKDCISFLV